MKGLRTAKDVLHHADQLQDARVTDAIVHAIGILSRHQHPLVTEDRQVLGDVALRRSHCFDNLLNTSLLIAQNTKNLQAQRMRNGLQGACRELDMLLLVDQVNLFSHGD